MPTKHTHVQAVDCIECFAGCASLSRCFRATGRATISLDVEYWNAWRERKESRGQRILGTSNPLDLLSASGFATLGSMIAEHDRWTKPVLRTALLAILQGNSSAGFLVVLAIVCSSFVSMSRATTRRSYCNPLGDNSVLSVAVGNVLASRPVCFKAFPNLANRLALMIYLIEAMGGKWLLEQPCSSLLMRHPRLREICRTVVAAFLQFEFEGRLHGVHPASDPGMEAKLLDATLRGSHAEADSSLVEQPRNCWPQDPEAHELGQANCQA